MCVCVVVKVAATLELTSTCFRIKKKRGKERTLGFNIKKRGDTGL